MYYSYVEIEYVATSFSPARTDLALKLLKIKHTKSHLNCAKKPDLSLSYGLKVKYKRSRDLLDSGLSGDLLFIKKGSIKHICIVKQAVPQLWGTSNGTFDTDKVGDIEILFMKYFSSKKVCLQPDIVEYNPGRQLPLHDLIMASRPCTT
jgi:hypothetical protein